MELDITDFFTNASAIDYSASQAETGADAGAVTWQAALEDSPELMLLDTDDKRAEWRDDVRGFGAWDDTEIDAWTDAELNALLIQFISGDIREMESLCSSDWDEYRRLSEHGTVSGRMYQSGDGRVYFYVGE